MLIDFNDKFNQDIDMGELDSTLWQSAYEFVDLIAEALNITDNGLLSKIESWAAKWVEKNTYITYVKAYTFHDGSNWTSLIVDTMDAPVPERDLIPVKGGLANKIISQYKDADFEKYTHGFSTAQTEDFEFTHTQYPMGYVATVEEL